MYFYIAANHREKKKKAKRWTYLDLARVLKKVEEHEGDGDYQL